MRRKSSGEALATTADQAVDLAAQIGYPVVMKIVSPLIAHKTEAGGVVVGVKTAADAEKTYETILANAKKYKADAKIDGETNAVPLVDTFRIHNPDATAVGTAHGFNGGTGGKKIDYVFTPPDQTVVNAYISHYYLDGRYPSDHFPVVGVIRFTDKE